MSGVLRDLAPPGFRRFLPPVFDRTKPDEPIATCDSCIMSKATVFPEESSTRFERGSIFDPNVKCCTYHPILPNFYVGELLADTDPQWEEGRRRIRAKIAARHGITPFWVRPSRKMRVMLDSSRQYGFGHSPRLLCPFLTEDKRCSIWQFREAVCSTWYCKHERGAANRRMWMTTKDYLIHAERRLAQYAVASIDKNLKDDSVTGQRMTLNDLEDRPPSDDEMRAMWGDWFGREEEFYVESFKRVQGLDSQVGLDLIQDREGDKFLADLADAHDNATSPQLEPHLVPVKALWRRKFEQGEAWVTYSNYDAQFLDKSLLDLVYELKADETTADFIKRMRREKGIDVPRALLQRLQDFHIAVPPTDASADKRTKEEREADEKKLVEEQEKKHAALGKKK